MGVNMSSRICSCKSNSADDLRQSPAPTVSSTANR
jgi:hypothetical protein